MGTKDQDIRARVTADVAGYTRGMAEAGRATNDFAKEARRAADEASSSWQRMAEVAAGVAGGLGLAKGLQVVSDLTIGLAKESALLNARYETLGVVMESVGRNVGYNRAQMAGYADEVRKMGITLIESRNTVVNMAQAQMDLSRASELARIAQDAAVIGNINSSEALNRLIYGVKTAQVEVLRNIGINVSFEQSYSRLAAQTGKSVEALSEAEKVQARMNAVVEAGTAIAGTYESAMDTAGKKVGSMARYVEDAKTILGETFNEALIIAVDGLTGELKDLNAEAERLQQQDALREWGREAVMTLAWVGDAASVVTGSFGQVWRDLKFLKDSTGVILESMKPGNIFGGFDAEAELRRIKDAYADSYVDVSALVTRFQDSATAQFRAADASRAARAAINELFKNYNEASAGTADAARKTEAYVAAVQGLISMQRGGAMSVGEFHLALRELQGETGRTRAGLDDVSGATGRVRDEVAALMGRLSSKDVGLDAGYAKDLQTLHAAYASGKVGVDEYRAAVEQLIAQQPFARDQARQQAQALREQAKQQTKAAQELAKQQAEALREQAEAQEQYAEAWSRHLGGLHEQHAALEEQIELYGLTEAQIAAVNTQRAAERLEIAKRNGVDDAYIAALEKELELRQKIQAAAGTLEGKNIAADAAREAEQEWRRTAESIEQDLTDALMRGFESGKDFAENLRDTLVNMFKTLVLRPLIQPIAQGAAGGITNMISPGSSGMGIGNLGGGVNPSSLVGMIGNSGGWGAGFASGMSEAAIGSSFVGPSATLAPGAIGQGASVGASLGGAIMPGLGAYGFAQQYGVGGGIAGGLATTAVAGGIGGLATGAGFMAGAGGALAAMGPVGWAALVIGAILGGMGPNKPTNYWQGAEIDTATGAVQKTGSYDPDSRRYDPQNRAVADQFGAYLGSLSQTLARITGETLEHEIRIGVGSKDKHFTLDGVKTELKRGTNEDLIDLAATTLVDMVYDKLSNASKAVVDALRDEGESIEGALVWVNDGLPELNKWLGRFGVELLDINVEGVRAAEALAQIAGGVENLAALQGGYYDAFFSDAEKVLYLHDDLAAALNDLGLGMVNSRDGFRQLVEAQDLSTDAGQSAYVGLLALAPEMGRYLTMLDEQLDSTDAATAAAREYRAALDEQARAASDAVGRLQRLSSLLRGTLDRMSLGTQAEEAMRRDRAQAQITTALALARASGRRTLPDADAISPALSRLAEPSAHLFATFEDYAADYARTANTISGLLEITDEQLSTEEQALRWMKERSEVEDGQHADSLEQQRLAAETLAAQNDILAQIAARLEADASADAGKGGAGGTGTAGLREYMSAETIAGATSALAGIGVTQGGAVSEAQALQIYDAWMNGTAATLGVQYLSDIDQLLGLRVGTAEQWIKNDPTRANEAFPRIPAFAGGGDHAGGWALIGEHGPELAHLPPSRIYNRAQSQSLIDIGPMVAELRALRADVAQLKHAQVATAKHSQRAAQALDEMAERNEVPA